MRKYILNETNLGHIRSSKIDLAILPWGATEPHNLHLPYGTDTLETEYIASRAAADAEESGCQIMVLPVISLGMQNKGQVDIPFCINTSITTQLMILKDIAKSLLSQGIRKLLIINGHGGNKFKPIIRELSVELSDFFIGLTNWYDLLDNSQYFTDPGDHAGEMETSIMMYAFPDLVDILTTNNPGEVKYFRAESLRNKSVWSPRDWSKISSDTGIGDPGPATPEKGEIFLKDLIKTLSGIYSDLCKMDIKDMYL